eukprot:COSAG01_NODE_6812_length_3486_cov_32.265427_1_plen_60_part_10
MSGWRSLGAASEQMSTSAFFVYAPGRRALTVPVHSADDYDRHHAGKAAIVPGDDGKGPAV